MSEDNRLYNNAYGLLDALQEIRNQAHGHKRSIAYNDGVNIALANIEAIAIHAIGSNERQTRND